MTEFEGQVLADLNVLKSQMGQLMGIGQPGRLERLEARVSASEQMMQRTQGFLAAFGTVLTLTHLAITWFSTHPL
jgi:hypothetical protein